MNRTEQYDRRTIEVVEEDANRWVVRCQRQVCPNTIDVPKRIDGAPTAVTRRWCQHHEPDYPDVVTVPTNPISFRHDGLPAQTKEND